MAPPEILKGGSSGNFIQHCIDIVDTVDIVDIVDIVDVIDVFVYLGADVVDVEVGVGARLLVY